MNIFDAIGGIFSDWTGTWDRFRNGDTNKINQEEAEKQRAFDEEQARLAREAEEKNTLAVNDTNKAIADSTNAMNKAIADQNLAFQRENLDYQKGLQQQIFEREDTAYERTAQDMANAGLNPLTMNGTNGAGEVISTTAQNNDMQAQGWIAEKNQGAGIRAKYERFQAVAGGIADVLNTLTGVTNAFDNLNSGFAQRDLLRSQKQSIDEDNAIKLFNLGYSPSYFDDIPYVRPVNPDGSVPSPLNFKDFTNNNDWYDPQRRNMLKSIESGRELENNIKYNLFNYSTPWERNMTSFERALDAGRFYNFAGKLGNHAYDLINKFLDAVE